MFRKLSTLLATGVFSMLLSFQAPVMARDLTAGAEQPDNTFWLTIKDTTLPDLFEMFIKRYPDSPHRALAEQRLKNLKGGKQLTAIEQAKALTRQATSQASKMHAVPNTPTAGTRAPVLAAPVLAAVPLSASAPTKAPAVAEPVIEAPQNPSQTAMAAAVGDTELVEEVSHDTVILIQHNLNRVGCSVGKLDGKWGPKSQASAARFASLTELPLVTALPNTDLLDVLKGFDEGTCPPIYQKKPRVKKLRRARTKSTHRKVKKVKLRKKAKKKVVKKKVKKSKKVNTASKKKKKTKTNVNVPIVVIQSGIAFGFKKRKGRGGSNGGGGQFSVRTN